ncbi:hypothetical protein [Bordetella sp. BOR01]|uniref:hypothetical protein n=1 Tax=Bordetella sp. BOR01 TaxID=2854779 RepID=UPI001C477DDB|nr:hypothetical protein [Bordetella sp. BOR01]MBV7481795.1 hypothetical protein [Bordetella sp. BOR01]
MSPPNVLPGSDAAKAAAEVGQYIADQGADLQLPELEQYVKERIIAYGGDPVTAAASARTVTVLAERDPTNTQTIAENIVASTVSDPNAAADRIRDSVERQVAERGGIGNLSKDEQKALAYGEAEDALRRAGITDTQSYADLRTRVNEYIDQGASPEVAAAAAAAPALAAAGPSADSLSIFGYLIMLVHGDLKYVFKNTETFKVGGNAIHSHMKDVTYEMPPHNLHIDCDTIQTSSTGEFLNIRLRWGRGVGTYPGEYRSLVSTSFTAYAITTKWGMKWLLLGLYSLAVTKQRVYLAGIDNDIVFRSRSIGDDKDKRKSLLTIRKTKILIERAKRKYFKT